MHYKMRDQIRFKIGKEEKNIQEKWIEIPEGTEHIQMMIEMPEEFRYMAFLFLEDPKKEIRFQKLLGYGQQNPGIGKSTKDTTIGGVPGEIYPGTWKIGIGIFTEYVAQKLGEQTGEIVLTVSDRKDVVSDPIGGECWGENGLHVSEKSYRWENVFCPESGWYKGDFHTHTRLSDGKETIGHASERAEESGLDFYVPTEHNLMHTGWCKTSLCVLPGIEVTTDKGHMNLFGITEMPEKILEIVKHNGEEVIDTYMDQTIAQAKQKGWIRSINHPFLTGSGSLKIQTCGISTVWRSSMIRRIRMDQDLMIWQFVFWIKYGMKEFVCSEWEEVILTIWRMNFMKGQAFRLRWEIPQHGYFVTD